MEKQKNTKLYKLNNNKIGNYKRLLILYLHKQIKMNLKCIINCFEKNY